MRFLNAYRDSACRTPALVRIDVIEAVAPPEPIHVFRIGPSGQRQLVRTIHSAGPWRIEYGARRIAFADKATLEAAGLLERARA